MLRIVHVIERLGTAGPERSILAAAKYAGRAGLRQQHTICTLTAAVSPLALALARQSGVQVLRNPAAPARADLLRQADLVVAHFWNNPALYAFLRSDLPAMRLLVWLKVFGSHAPQVAPRSLHAFADLVVASSPGTLALPGFAELAQPAPVIFGIADFDRLADFAPQPHPGFAVGLIGSVGPGKIHPDFVPMSAAVAIPEVRFVVCAAGDAERLGPEAKRLQASQRFEFRGYVENIRSALAGWDLFGYPLSPDTYATSEKALQEAMWVGLPPVVFPYGGVRHLVADNDTGLVVNSAAEYTRAIERLYHEPAERRRLGANARAHARAAFDPLRAVGLFADLYDSLMQQPKRERRWPDDGATPGAWFAAALGDQGGAFLRSLRGPNPAAEAEIAAASDLLFSGEGGIVHYRNTYPADPHLHHWTGLVLQRRGQPAEAAKMPMPGGN
jgi:glycosyltransferase involved in cell wall biosynthesis